MDLLEVAGDAAALLEQHGLVACARRVSGVVTLDCFGTSRGKHVSFRFPVTSDDADCQVLASRVLSEIAESMTELVPQSGVLH
jgi:hypothetical protein